MVFTKYDFPLPNKGDRYDLSQEELVKILDHVYDCGFEHARDVFDPKRQGVVSVASTDDIKDGMYVEVPYDLGRRC